MGFGALAYIDEEGHRSYLYYEERAAGPVLVVVVGWGPDVSRSELRSLTDRAAARVDAVVGRPS
jgi:hypothetical protein